MKKLPFMPTKSCLKRPYNIPVRQSIELPVFIFCTDV